MTPTVDRFRALARSSPWRWTSLHLTRHGDDGTGPVEAWVDRATGVTRLRDSSGRMHRETVQSGGTVVSFYASDGGRVSEPPRVRHVRWSGLSPRYRDDGFVAARPEDSFEDADGVVFVDRDEDPMYRNYQWVAMLDPVELSHDVDLTDLVATERRGRETWTATAVPQEEYDPTCGCCALLWSEAVDRGEFSDYDRRWPEGRNYPDTHRISLDIETGVLVVLTPHGGDVAPPWSVDIHEVDGPDPFS